jgi:hypothetical protein
MCAYRYTRLSECDYILLSDTLRQLEIVINIKYISTIKSHMVFYRINCSEVKCRDTRDPYTAYGGCCKKHSFQ